MKRIDFRWLFLCCIVVVICAYIFLFHTTPGQHYLGVCWFKFITGFPCPACGSTRATYALLHGNWYQALWYNPLAILTNLFIFIALFWMGRDIIFNKNTLMLALHKKWPVFVQICAFTIIVIVWIWNIYKGL